eukprot:4499481-Pyramimonas_sp.AAC.1
MRGVVRAVCRQWCASHDALLTRLKVLDDEGLCALVSFPCAYRHKPRQVHQGYGHGVVDAWQPLRTHLSRRPHRLRRSVTDVGVLGSFSALASLNLTGGGCPLG